MEGWKSDRKRKYWKVWIPAVVLAVLAIAALGAWKAGWLGTGNAERQETMAGKPVEGQDGAEGEENAEDGEGTGAGMDIPEGQSEDTAGEKEEGDIEEAAEEKNGEFEEEEPEGAKRPEKKNSSIKVKGIYVTGPIAGNPAFQDLIKLVDDTELNAMVIDVKNDEGKITWKMDLESAQEIGACTPYISDIQEFMEEMKAHGIYTIARIVCFKDPYLAKGRPELALKKPDGTPVTDANGMAWVNPYREEVWEYLAEISEKAAEAGFDEIQFDYVRFPIGDDADAADYGVDMQSYTRQQAIGNFLDYAVSRLHEKDIIVTADVFGTIIGSEVDVERVGQDYKALAQCVDVLCPMVYPSHYGNHVFGLEVPDAQPYETVLAALEGSREELSGIPEEERAVVRPWLQAFTATWVNGHISYEGEEIRGQIQAVYDAGYEEWILWNAVNRYSADGLEPAEGINKK